MALEAGTRLGAYEIVGPLGSGGMGEVYRARDVRLGRDVAIKVLPHSLRDDLERLARFEREAKTLAALSHPNIANIFGFDDSSGVPALAMELVDGPTLADRIARGPLPVDETLQIARQIADGLEAAHEQGIVHRDLKPANIKVRTDGAVKVLDFGLAKAFDTGEGAAASSRSLSMSPTLTAATQLGVILGTAAYMSPEQARGKPVDKRTDIWAFGAILYEMLSGRSAFAGDEISDTLAFVITKEPEWSALPTETPAAVQRLLRRCLEKDRKRRLADIADARFEIDEALRPSGASDPRDALPGPADGRRRGLLLSIWAALATVAAAVAFIAWSPWKPAASSPPLRLSVDVGANLSLAGAGQAIEISPAGDTIAFIGRDERGTALYVRHLTQLSATRLEGTAGAASPFFSPNGDWIGYFAEGKLKKIPVNGGASVTLTDGPGARGAAWSEDGSIAFMRNPAGTVAGPVSGQFLNRVSASGGTSEPLTKAADGEVTHRWPQMLNGGTAVLFTASGNLGGYEEAHIVVQQLPAGPRKTLLTGGYHARYVSSGHILYMHAGTLFALPFDLKRLEVTGTAVPVIEGVAANPGTGAANFTVSNAGTLTYVVGEGGLNSAPIVWIDRSGNATPLRNERANWSVPQFAPDGHRLAFDVRGPQSRILLYEWERDTTTQLTVEAGEHTNPVWSPDGRFLAFASRRAGAVVPNLFVQRADGSGTAAKLLDSQNNPLLPTSWHPSGKFLAFNETRQGSGQDVMILPVDVESDSNWKAGKSVPFVATGADEFDAQFSPDGQWVAYVSTESGAPEVFVRPFPGLGGKWKISTEPGARSPIWSRTRKELLYRSAAGNRLMVVTYAADGDSFRADKPQLWAEGDFSRPNGQRGFDIHPDGQRVAASGGRQAEAPRQDKAIFVFNFFDELRRIAPPAR